jgi:hypothetical protein
MTFSNKSIAKYNKAKYKKVIKCKDCIHYLDSNIGWCKYHSYYTDEYMTDWIAFQSEDYCSWAERK